MDALYGNLLYFELCRVFCKHLTSTPTYWMFLTDMESHVLVNCWRSTLGSCRHSSTVGTLMWWRRPRYCFMSTRSSVYWCISATITYYPHATQLTNKTEMILHNYVSTWCFEVKPHKNMYDLVTKLVLQQCLLPLNQEEKQLSGIQQTNNQTTDRVTSTFPLSNLACWGINRNVSYYTQRVHVPGSMESGSWRTSLRLAWPSFTSCVGSKAATSTSSSLQST